jgi:type IV fimbrial biogenesis protein FimT
MHMRSSRSMGFTIMELMLTIAVAAVLFGIAVPYMGDFVKNGRIKSSMYDMLNAINVARSEAVKRKATVTLCRSNDTVTTPSCGGTANTWTTGWLVFVDTDGDGVYDTGETLLATGNPTSGTVAIMGTANSLSYNPDGTVTTITRFAICDDRGEDWGRQIDVLLVGRANVTQGTTDSPISNCTNPT